MRRKRVKEIVISYREGVALDPSVTMDDKVVDAIELMVKNDLNSIAVVRSGRPVGMVRLEEALHKLGLKDQRKKREG